MKTIDPQKPGRFERSLSMVILAVLVIVGGGIYLRQFSINPAVIALRPESQQSASSSTIEPAAVIDTTGSDMIPFSPPEHFIPNTLYEKIDGRADLYLASGFASLSAQRFTVQGATGNWIEVFVYDMQTPENAFSVYSMQRREEAIPDDRLPNAYRTENALFMVHGRFYLELIGTDTDVTLSQSMGTLARLFVEAHAGVSIARAPGADLFPAEGLDAGTRQLITANAFGYEALDHLYAAEYLIGGIRVTAFVSDRQTPEAASALAGTYRQTLLSYGATIVDTQPSPAEATVLQFFDTYEIIFSRGRYLAGVHEAADLKSADRVARLLADHLEHLDGK